MVQSVCDRSAYCMGRRCILKTMKLFRVRHMACGYFGTCCDCLYGKDSAIVIAGNTRFLKFERRNNGKAGESKFKI